MCVIVWCLSTLTDWWASGFTSQHTHLCVIVWCLSTLTDWWASVSPVNTHLCVIYQHLQTDEPLVSPAPTLLSVCYSMVFINTYRLMRLWFHHQHLSVCYSMVSINTYRLMSLWFHLSNTHLCVIVWCLPTLTDWRASGFTSQTLSSVCYSMVFINTYRLMSLWFHQSTLICVL